MSFSVLALLALLPFALVGFLYRDTHVDMRPALLSAAAILAVVVVLIAVLVDL